MCVICFLQVEHILINIDLRYSSQTERFRRAAQEGKVKVSILAFNMTHFLTK